MLSFILLLCNLYQRLCKFGWLSCVHIFTFNFDFCHLYVMFWIYYICLFFCISLLLRKLTSLWSSCIHTGTQRMMEILISPFVASVHIWCLYFENLLLYLSANFLFFLHIVNILVLFWYWPSWISHWFTIEENEVKF